MHYLKDRVSTQSNVWFALIQIFWSSVSSLVSLKGVILMKRLTRLYKKEKKKSLII